jgi:hypothetical protein
MVSLEEQKQYFLSPCHCLLAKLSLVKITLLYKYHIKTLTLRGSLSFQIKVLYGSACIPNNALYKELTENNSFRYSLHTKRSLWLLNYTSAIMVTTLCHASKLTPIRDLLKVTFNNIVDSTDLTEALFFLTMLYGVGKIVLRGCGIIHESSQKHA